VSRQIVPDTFHGRVSGLLENLTVTPGCHFYLCGLDAMIHTGGHWREARGVDPFSIHREVFFNASQ
jgi:ferredoxin-NADP reductase